MLLSFSGQSKSSVSYNHVSTRLQVFNLDYFTAESNVYCDLPLVIMIIINNTKVK